MVLPPKKIGASPACRFDLWRRVIKLKGKDIYLDTLTREDCKALWNATEYDFQNPTEELKLGLSDEKAEVWFEEIQALQGSQNVRLGIFGKNGIVIGDIALQKIDRVNRKCSIGMGIARVKDRAQGFGQQAVKLMLKYGFEFLGMERICANTLSMNVGAQKALEKCGFILEGREREAVYLNGRKYDRLNYAILKSEYIDQWL